MDDLQTALRAAPAIGEAFSLPESLFDTAPVGMAFIDSGLRYRRVNAALAEINGLPISAHIGHTLREVVPQLADEVEPIYRTVMSTRRPIINVAVSGHTAASPDRIRHWLVTYYPIEMAGDAEIWAGTVVIEISALREAEHALRSALTNLRAIFESSAQGIMLLDTELRVVQWNSEAERHFQHYFGRPVIAGEQLGATLPPPLADEMQSIMRQVLAGQQLSERRNVGLDDQPVWMALGYTPIYDGAGVVQGICITALDVTAEHVAQIALQHYANDLAALSARLVNAHETERRALAHELHDEIGQLLTGLNMVLEAGADESPEEIRARLREAQQVVTDLTSHVRRLSLDLRPPMLDDMGLLPALEWLVQRYTKQTGIGVSLKHRELPAPIAPATAIAAYRVVQEGLTNVARHAHVDRVDVQIWASQGQLSISVEDEGRGFTPERALSSHHSIGLIGMRERVALLGGLLRIDSAPGEGTRLLATLPL